MASGARLSRSLVLIAFVVWQFLSTVVFNPFLIPPPLVVFKTMVPMVENGEIFTHVAISLARVAVGFITGCVAAIVLGVLLGRIRLVNELLDPDHRAAALPLAHRDDPDRGDLVRHRRAVEVLPHLLGHVLHRADQHHRRA